MAYTMCLRRLNLVSLAPPPLNNNNNNKRYETFFANRLAKIEVMSLANQWRYIDSGSNLADDATPGLTAGNLVSDSRWIHGPSFLLSPEQFWPQPPCPLPTLPEKYSVLQKQVNVMSTSVKDLSITVRFNLFSSWYRLKLSIAWILRCKKYLQKVNTVNGPITVEELNVAEKEIIVLVQKTGLC